MLDGQQTDGGTVAGVTTPTPTPNVTDTTDWKVQAETWQSRYNGQQTAMNKKSEEVKTWQQKYAELQAEHEGFKGTKDTELTDLQKRHQTLEQQLAELSKKTAQYERQDTIRSLIHSTFPDLAPEFESDPIYRQGILSAAEQMDEAALKESLTKSLELKKGQRAAAATAAVSGASSAAPNSGTSGLGNATEAQINEQIGKLPLSELGTPKHQTLMQQLREARKRNQA